MMSHTDTRPKNDSEKKLEATRDSSSADADVPRTRLFDAKAILWTFGKCLSALLPVYLAGYYRVSTSLVVFGMMVYAGWKHSREAKEARLRSAIQLLNDEQEHLSSKSLRSRRDLPSWVNFPDVEKVEWLNKVIHQAWPFIGQYLEKLLTETIAPSIRGSSAHLQTLSFTKIDFSDKPMKVVGVKTHTENDRGQILLDLYISYVGDVEIDVEVKRYFCKAGVKGIQLTGMMRVILEPLIGDVPIVGAVTMFFIQRPKLDINWTGLTNLLDIPGLNVMSDTMIMDAIASFLVLPNRLTVPLVPNIPVAQLRSPLPRGVVRVHLLEAEGLAVKDNYVKGVMSGMSDPYARLRVGPQTFKSRHHNNTLNPKWAEMYEFIVHEVPGQELELEVFDKDADQDDFLGRTKLDLGIVKKSKVVDEWWALQDISTGRVHLRLEWLTLDHSSERLEQVLKRNESVVSKTATPPSAAILVVYLDKAESLPRKKHDKDPNPMVQLSTQGITHESRVCWSTVNPQWEEAFTFFIKDPKNQDICLEVKDNDRVQALGSLSVSVSPLLFSSDLSLQQWFSLADSGPESRIHVHMVLRVLWVDEDAVVSSLLSTDLGSKGHTRPLHTSPHSSFATEGVLRIHLVEAQDLVAKDNLMGGLVKGKSDPYVKFQIGGESYKSRVIKENLNPSWNEMYEVVLTTLPGQDFFLEVFDKDMDMKDDFMGRLKINLSDIIRSQYMNEWFSLSDVKHGRVHLELEWLHTLTRPEELQQVLQFQSTRSYGNKSVPAAALLFVYVERAADLPLKKSGKEPKVGAELILSGTSHRTTVCERTSAPQWDEAFHFLVRDPLKEELVVKLSHSWDFPLGSVVIPVKELLEEADLLLDQWLQLDGASPESQILIRAQLKILCSKEMEGPEEQRTHQPSTRTQDQKSSVAAEEEAPPRSHDLQPPHSSSTEIPEMRTDDRHQDKVPAVSISKEAEKKALKGVMELAACTLPLSVPEEHHQPSEEHHTPAAPKAQQVEDISNIVPSSSVSEPGKTSGPEKTYYEEKHPEKATEPSAVTLPPPVGELKLSGSSDVRPQKSHPDSDFGSKGALRIHLLEAQDLVAKDNLMGMVKGKSDPYVKIHIADVTIKSHVIKENLNPTWNEMYEVILSPDHELEVKFEVYDKDVDSDDFLGRFKLKLGGIIRCQYNDEWFTLNDIKHGRVHLVLEWLPVTTQREKLDQVMQMQSVQSFQNKCVASAAMLFLFLDSAHDLPLKRSGKEPKAAAELTLGETIHKSKVCDRSSSPHWNDTFHFLVPDPKKDILVIKLSSAWEQPIGSLVLPIRELLSKSDLVLDQWLDLDGASSQSQILLRAQLKILDSKMAALLAMGSGPVLSNRLTATTGQIRLSLSFQKKLNVVVHACRALVSSCKDASDTYVSIILLPDKSKATKRKTSVKKRSLNPEFNESFEFDLSVEDVTRRELSVCVKNASTSFMNRDKDVIGQVQISLGQVDFVSGVTDWFDLKEEHN